MKVTPYLTFGGNCEEAMAFYAQTLGGKISLLMRFNEMSEFDAPEEIGHMIAHITLDLGDGRFLFASDTFELENYTGIEGVSLHVSRDTLDDAHVLFDKLRAEGATVMPIAKMSWSEGFGMCRDKFGVGWMVDYAGSS